MAEVTSPVPDEDPAFAQLLADLPEAWAKTETEEDCQRVALAFARACYGQGYVRALVAG
jgi:hypothetical protein